MLVAICCVYKAMAVIQGLLSEAICVLVDVILCKIYGLCEHRRKNVMLVIESVLKR